MAHKKKCEVCGVIFETDKGKKFCSKKCIDEHRRRYERKRYAEKHKGIYDDTLNKTFKNESSMKIARIKHKASPLGLSYGQYVAMIECGARYETRKE